MNKPIKVGSKVMYSAKFLKSIGVRTGDMLLSHGIVTAIKVYGGVLIATINWGGKDLPKKVMITNLQDAL